MEILKFFLLNTTVFLSAYFIIFNGLHSVRISDIFISWFIAYFTQIVFSTVTLGVLGLLTFENILLLNSVILVISWFWLGINKSVIHLTGRRRELLYFIGQNKLIFVIFCTLLGFASVKIFINLINPPFGWDSLNYHFTFAVEWLKNQNLNMPITIADDPSPPYYPIFGSIFYYWLILPFHDVMIADLGQLPFFIIGFTAVYAIARKTNLDKIYAFTAACLFTFIPNYFKHLEIAYVDVMVCALFLCSLNYIFLYEEKHDFSTALLFGLTTGLLIGTKTLALPYGALLLSGFTLICFSRKNIPHFFIGLTGAILFGGFSYFRNYMETGNPFYPLQFKLGNTLIFSGPMTHKLYGAHFTSSDWGLGKILFHEGLGLQTIIFVLPSVLFFWFVFLMAKNKHKINLSLKILALLPLLLYLIFIFVIPLANTRYLFPLLGCGMILGFWLIDFLSIPKKIIYFIVAICVITSLAEIANRKELVFSLLASALTMFLFTNMKLNGKAIFKNRVLALFSFIVISFFTLTILHTNYLTGEYERYSKVVKYSGFWPDATIAWEWLNTHTANGNIAYTGRPVPFPLYGSSLKNNVYYVSVNKIEPAKIHYFPKSHFYWKDDFLEMHKNFQEEGNYMSDSDYNIWLTNLKRKNTGFLFVYSLHQVEDRIIFPLEDSWAADHPEKFKLDYSNDSIHIYKVIA